MEVQWVGGEPLRLGPPHTAISLIFSMLLGNVYLSLYVTSLYLLHGHYATADERIIPHCLKLHICFLFFSLLINTKSVCQYQCVFVLFCRAVMLWLFQI